MNRSPLYVLATSLFLVAWGGCTTRGPLGHPMEHPDTPQSQPEARRLEFRGLGEIRDSHKISSVRKRREHYDRALAYFREARDLYVEELIEEPGTPLQQEFLKAEIERLADLIEHTHIDRPITREGFGS